MSEPQALWTAAFTKAQKSMPEIAKGKTAKIETRNGKSYSYSYADLPEIIKAVRPVLADQGLGFAQSVEVYEGGVAVMTRIYHEAGHVEVFGPIVLPSGSDAQSAGSAITYARRYSLCAALGIAADEDDDAQAAVQKKDSNWSAASPSTPLEAREQNAQSTTASTGAEEPSVAPSTSAPVAAGLWDRIDQGVKANTYKQNIVFLKAKRIAMAAEAPIPETYGEIGKLRSDLLRALADDLKLDERVPA